jgi:hypothetical protein
MFMNITHISRQVKCLSSLIVAATVSLPIAASAATLTIPGTSNPYLAGLPNGATASVGDTAPAQSPVLATGISIIGGNTLSFLAVGSTDNGGGTPFTTPDGGSLVFHGAENGFSGLTAPINALVGVFLDNNLATASIAPTALDFSTASSQTYLSLSPLLKQIFFIGDGVTGTGSGTVQKVVIPIGATRLFIGTVDGYDWNNNSGQIIVDIRSTAQSVPEPFTVIGTLVGGTAALRMRKKLKSTAKQ